MSYTPKGQKRKSHRITCGKGRTKQEFVAIIDINNIMARYRKTGSIDHISNKQPLYEDVSHAQSYQNSLNIVINAETHFANMPSKIRTRFNNDPVKMLEFLNDPDNRKEAEKLGMVKIKDEQKSKPKETKPDGEESGDVHRTKATKPKRKDEKKD